MNPIVITSKITFKQYLNLMFLMTYRKPIMWVMTSLGLMFIVASVLHFANIYMFSDTPPYFQLAIGFIIVLILPTSIYQRSRKTYHSDKRLLEEVKYTISKEIIELEGESFRSEFVWKEFYKIDELTNWIMIYESATSSILISKTSFSGNQLDDFKTMAINSRS